MSAKPNTRIIFLDLMRALAVLMMIQGHTIEAFLGDQYRSVDSNVYNVWVTLRGFTAPIFMFTSGVTFTYLFRLQQKPFLENPRVKKGIHRVIILVLIGYILRFPTPRMIDFSEVTHLQWMIFFTVDALHLIGISMLFIMCLAYLAEKYKLSDYLVFSLGALFFIALFPITEKINWANILPIPFAAYLYHGTGSLFPFFPWSAYVICGGILGSYLAKNYNRVKSKKFSLQLLGAGLILIVSSEMIHLLEGLLNMKNTFWTDQFSLFFYRLGVVVLLNGSMSILSAKLESIPIVITYVGKNTLWIYSIHAVILYGSAWIPGFAMFYPKSLNIPLSILAAAVLIILMCGVVLVFEQLKNYRRRKFIALEI